MAPSSTYKLPQRISLWDSQLEGQKMASGMGISQSEAKKVEEDAGAEEERKCMAAEAAEESEKSASEVTEDGSF